MEVEEKEWEFLSALTNETLHDMVIDLCAALHAHAKPEAWVVHIIGPDDLIEGHTELSALREANNLNAFMLDHPDLGAPRIVAVAKQAR